MSSALAGLSVTQHLLGHTEAALRAALDYEACQTLTLSALPWFQAAAIEIAPALVAGGQQAHAFALLREAEKSVRKLGLPLGENHLLCITGVVEYLRGNPDRAADELARAYMGAGSDIFEGADKYLAFLKTRLQPPPGGW